MSDKNEAWGFFSALQAFLNRSLPPPGQARDLVPQIVERAKNSTDERHKAFPEGAFLNEFVAPAMNTFLLEEIGLDQEDAATAFLSESYKQLGGRSSGSPARSKPHPFAKGVGATSKQIIDQWRGLNGGSSVVQSCPDMALRKPSPFKVVIEGKYFSKGGPQAAATALAKDLYQAFFYLGLSNIPESPSHPAWDYDYSCLMAFDATPDGNLLAAWESLDAKVKKGCWEGANIFVMILRGNN